MQIVIDIDEKNYKNILKGLAVHRCALFDAIKNGTPLPKGHGKLVDVEDVKNNIRKWRGYLDEDMMARINFTMDNNIPTIIEADKGSEE